MRRSERVAVLVRLLLSAPGHVIPLTRFAGLLDAARSTLSEDVALIRETFRRYGLGAVETVAGAAGGVRYRPLRTPRQVRETLAQLAAQLSQPDRVLPGGFIYMTDIVFSPQWTSRIGEVFATAFAGVQADCVISVETKGIPIALETARAMGLPLVICRRDSRITEGPSVSITYVSGTSRTIQSMSLPKRALRPGSRVIFVDDFLRGGGTAKGIRDLMAEFGAEVVATGVLVATREPAEKRVHDYLALCVVERVDELRREVQVTPNHAVADAEGAGP